MSTIGNTPGVSSQRFVQREVIAGISKAAFVVTTGYSLGYVDVHLNGSQLDEGDFTASDGVNVILAQAAVVGDVVRIIAWLPRGLSDGYLKSEANGLFLRKAGEDGIAVFNGNVGIGNGAPSYRLDIRDSALPNTVNSYNFFQRFEANSGNADWFETFLYRNASASGWTQADWIIQRNVDGTGGQSQIRFLGSNATSFWTNGGECARFNSSRHLLLGTTSFAAGQNSKSFQPDAILSSRSTTGGDGHIIFFNPNGVVGQIYTSGSSTSFATSSDYRLKEDVQPMTNALARVALLNPVTYKWKVDGSDGEGFIAHELQAVVPDAVMGEKDAVNEDGSIKAQGIDTSFLVATLTAAIQEQQAFIIDQDVKIGQLVDQLTNAESTMNLLTEMFTESQQTVAALNARVEALEGTPQ